MLNYFKSWQKPKNRVLSEALAKINFSESWQKFSGSGSYQEISDFELFFQLTYMCAVASAGISRSRIFQLGAALRGPSGHLFEKVHELALKLGYDYAQACNIIGASVGSEGMRSLLLRLSGALTSGQPELEFLTEETTVQTEAYEKEYERAMEVMAKWTDAYAAMSVSSSLIIIINLISAMIYNVGPATMVGLFIVAVLAVAMGAYVIYQSAPKEKRVFFSAEGTQAQRLAGKLGKTLPWAALVAMGTMFVLKVPLGLILLLDGVIMLPVGILSLRAEAETEAKEKELGPLLRSLGARAVSTGTTISDALERTDLSSFPHLQPDILRLRWRLKAAINIKLCWRKFSQEIGSVLIGQTITIFNDAVELGAAPDTVAFLSSQYSAKIISLRARRKVTAATFSGLSFVMHGTIAFLMILILEVVGKFSSLMAQAMSSEGRAAVADMALPLPGFNSPQTALLHTSTTAMVLLFVVINTLAIIAADGGHKYKTFFYLPLMMFITAVGFLSIPSLIRGIMP